MNPSMTRQRKEIKAILTEEKTRTIVDRFLQWISRGRPFSMGNAIPITFLLSIAASWIIVFLSGDLSRLYQAGPRLPIGWASLIVFSLFMSTASMFLGNAFLRRVVAVLRDQVVDLAESPATLGAIRSWVEFVFGKPLLIALFVLLGGIFSAAYVIIILSNLTGTPFRISFLLAFSLFSIQSSVFVGVGLVTLLLALRMWSLDLSLFESDPASSEVIHHVSGLFSSYVYLVAVYGAIQTFGIVRTGLVSYSIPLLFVFWTPILAIFIGSQLSLAKIIQRSKWKELDSIQKKVAALQKNRGLPNNEDRDSITWLLDYHQRVRSTRNSALDLSSWLNFLNSLLLPLIAFILGNIDTVIELFSGQP